MIILDFIIGMTSWQILTFVKMDKLEVIFSDR